MGGNVGVVRQAFDAFVGGDYERWLALASPAIKLYPPRDEPGVRPVYEGSDEMVEYLVNWYSGWQDYSVSADRFIDAGEWVIVDVTEVGIAERSGMRVEESFAHALRVDDGKIVEWRMFARVPEALEALGVDERLGS
jgi:ketosteroid isomerase-like protein